MTPGLMWGSEGERVTRWLGAMEMVSVEFLSRRVSIPQREREREKEREREREERQHRQKEPKHFHKLVGERNPAKKNREQDKEMRQRKQRQTGRERLLGCALGGEEGRSVARGQPLGCQQCSRRVVARRVRHIAEPPTRAIGQHRS
jgi:hypothetical protein